MLECTRYIVKLKNRFDRWIGDSQMMDVFRHVMKVLEHAGICWLAAFGLVTMSWKLPRTSRWFSLDRRSCYLCLCHQLYRSRHGRSDHDVGDAGIRVDLELSLPSAQEVLNGCEVLFVHVLMLPELRACVIEDMSALSSLDYPYILSVDKAVPGEFPEITPNVLEFITHCQKCDLNTSLEER